MSYYGDLRNVERNKVLTVVVDSDAIVAQTDPNDSHHTKALAISASLSEKKARIIYPSSTVLEAATHIQRVLNSTASAYGTASVITSPLAEVAEVSKSTIANALQYLNPNSSKQDTLFDCVVATIAREYQADAVFSFDKFYKKKGFKLASEL